MGVANGLGQFQQEAQQNLYRNQYRMCCVDQWEFEMRTHELIRALEVGNRKTDPLIECSTPV